MAMAFWLISGALACGLAWWLSRPLQATHKKLASGVLLAVPLIGLGGYLLLGSPNQPDAPLAPRLEGELTQLPTGAVLAKLEQRLREAPDDREGWRLLARLRSSLGAHDRAADAWRRVVDLGADDAEPRVGLARALIEQDGGVISDAAVFWLDEALKIEDGNLSAQFWRGLAWQQQGEPEQARRVWQALRQRLPDAVPFAKMLDAQLATLPPAPPTD